jgi:N-formylglutamate amidohydrolase
MIYTQNPYHTLLQKNMERTYSIYHVQKITIDNHNITANTTDKNRNSQQQQQKQQLQNKEQKPTNKMTSWVLIRGNQS